MNTTKPKTDMEKNIIKHIAIAFLMAFVGVTDTMAASWDFTNLGSSDLALLQADENWFHDTGNDNKNDRYCYTAALTTPSPLMANGAELQITKGLLFKCNANTSGNIRIGNTKNKSLWLAGASTPLIIPGLKKTQTITVRYLTSKNTEARTFTLSDNVAATSGFEASTDEQTGVCTVTSDGDVTLTPTGGLYVYSLEVSDVNNDKVSLLPGAEATLYADVVTHAVNRSSKTNQMQVELNDGSINYYNTDEVSAVDVDKDRSTVTITPASGSSDVYYGSVRNISFTKGTSQGENAVITNNGVVITEAKGWLESAYVKWQPYQGASSYVVYVKGGNFSQYTKIDNMLVRNYGSYGRADMVGLKAGNDYALKVVPVINNTEDESKASFAENIKVSNYSREGFAHKNHTGVGAYNDDGTLKSNAKVLYVTKNTAKTIKCNVITSEKGATTEYTGLQNILDGYQKGYDSTPLAIRLIGKVSLSDLDKISSSEEGLQIKSNKSNELNITIEGIGEDATIHGFGILCHGARSVELRNFAVMMFMDDAISIDTENYNVWVHHLDIFYGQPGSDSDQAKGDGSIDIKSDSKYITVDNCHFWDAGKASLCGMKSESGPNYITYHHNWFDHSDSRHARVRSMSVHIWNNYFDGNSKYGAGATTGSSLFVESNYFRNVNKPMLISMQGTDTKMGTDEKNAPTFSNEDGGIIKSYGNIFAERSSNFKYVTYQQNSTHFDAWEASSRNAQVPSTVKAKQGGSTYDNFDTNSSLMYSYTPDAAADVPAKVEGWYGAGRMNHGDFEWTFNNSSEDSNYGVIEALKTALINYSSSLVGIFGGETIGGGGGDEPGGDEPGGDEPGGDEPGGSTINAEIACTFAANNGYTNSNVFTISGNTSNSKGTAVVNGETLSWCLKLESSTSVKFTLEKAMTMTLVFGSQDEKYTIKVDGAKMTGAQDPNVSTKQGILTVELAAGEHVLTKADTGNLFYIGLK